MRRSTLLLFYEGKDISTDIAKSLISFVWTEKADGEADDIQITISDKNKVWQADWLPERGHVLSPFLRYQNWFAEGDMYEISCGEFMVDEVELEASDIDTLTIKAVPKALSSAISGQQKTKSWNNARLESIAQDIASTHGLELVYKASDIPLGRVDQSNEADLVFLSELCTNQGCRLKLASNSIIIFEGALADKLEPITLSREYLNSFCGKISSADVYSSVELLYTNPQDGKESKYTFAPNNVSVEKVLTLNQKVESAIEGERLAKALLREKNSKAQTATASGMDNPFIRAGAPVLPKGFNAFDIVYAVDEITRTFDSGSTTLSMSLVSALEY